MKKNSVTLEQNNEIVAKIQQFTFRYLVREMHNLLDECDESYWLDKETRTDSVEVAKELTYYFLWKQGFITKKGDIKRIPKSKVNEDSLYIEIQLPLLDFDIDEEDTVIWGVEEEDYRPEEDMLCDIEYESKEISVVTDMIVDTNGKFLLDITDITCED